MKGTIDIQIKHKDGSIDNRHEHNVIFDIPALTFAKWSESPLAIATGVPTPYTSLTSSRFNEFCLSEDTISTTEPQYVPPTLVTTTGSSTVWYKGPATTTETEKSKVVSATWTVPSALTLKSIFFRTTTEKYLMYFNTIRFSSKNNIYKMDSEIDRLKPSLLNSSKFSLKSKSWNCLVPSNASTSDTYEYTYVDYPLCNPNERFVFSYVSSGETRYSSSGAGTGITLEIRDKDTNNILRSFPMTQFTGYRTTYSPPSGSSGSNDYSYYCNYIVNTGAKNVLIQPTYLGKSLNIWQIPDTATEDPIPVAATVLENECGYGATYSGDISNLHSKTIGPYISWVPSGQSSSSSRKANIVRVNDDFSITKFSGYSSDKPWELYYYVSSGSSGQTGQYYPYRFHSGKMLLKREVLDYNSWEGGTGNSGIYTPSYPNITAANFSTPIVLAEGDVLTVSYKIEVA